MADRPSRRHGDHDPHPDRHPSALVSPLRIDGAYVLPFDDGIPAGLRSVVIDGDRIAAVLAPEEAGPADAERFDASGTILLPGFVNAHLHPEAHVLKGWVEGVDLHAWRRARRFEAALHVLGSPAGRSVQRAAIRASLAEALLGGTTCVATYGVTAHADVVAAEVLEEFGLRGHITVRDIAFEPVADGPATALSPPRMYRLHAEEALPASELEAAAGAARRGERIVMHAAETRARVRLARRKHGVTTIRLLERYGLLSPRMLLSHAVHVDAEERALIARAGAVVIASPAAEMKLGDGIAPITDYLAAGVTVALGTDAALCNNATDMLLECRMLGLSQSLRYGPAAAPSPLAILGCATAAGAGALGEHRGRIAPGRVADLVLVDTGSARMRPPGRTAEDVAARLVYGATAADVRDVMVGGAWRVRGGRLVDIDERALLSDLDAAAETLAAAV